MGKKVKGICWSNSKKVPLDGYVFDSRAEADYYLILKDLLKKKQIKKMEIQVSFRLPDMDGGFRFRYTPDFVVTKNDGTKVYLEVKGRFMPGNKIRYAYWQHYYGEVLTIIPTSGVNKLNTNWLY